MQAKLAYVIKFVGRMDEAVRYHRDTLGLTLKFQSPEWSEFQTGDVTLALHAASKDNPPGKVQLGYNVDDLTALYENRGANGIDFTSPPRAQHGTVLAKFRDNEGSDCSISGKR
ncbi:MAG: VOC family protein [Alphaproteobacteria bacterium]|nr:VOC family protein [Alphaproteobacteria bacterium]